MISLLLAAAFATSPVVLTQSAGNPVRYVRVTMSVDGYDIRGSGTLLVDRQTGHYTEHLDLGPQSFYQGFDGTRAWQSDVNGTTAVQGDPIGRGTVIAWGKLFAFPQPASVRGTHVRYSGVPQTATVMLDDTHRMRRFALFNGAVNETASFSQYRRFSGNIVAPSAITFTDDNGTWKARVTNVEPVDTPIAAAFAPPSRRNDASIDGGVTSVPFEMATEIIIPVRINNGPVMHFILDTGGQNLLVGEAAKKLGLNTVGHGTVGGAGAGVIPTTFAMVQSVRIGTAVMRDQPFLILNTPLLKGIDGIVGYEMLSRFAARIDYRTNTLWLASSLPHSWIAGAPATPFTFVSRQPEVPGSIDGFQGLLTIDTGNSGTLDVNTPFALAHDLWSFYGAAKAKFGSLAGVGGKVLSSNIVVRRLHIGAAILHHVYGDLTRATAGVEANPAVAANAGEGIFRNYTFVLDYPDQRLYFAPGGISDESGVLLERRGNRIVVRQVRTNSASRAGVRPGMTLTSINGKPVTGRDLQAVQSALRGQPGSRVELVFDGRVRAKLTLRNYL
jgi:hypothetical protein